VNRQDAPVIDACFVVGARPNFMKVAPVYHALAQLVGLDRVLLVHTGQHYDELMSDVFLTDLRLPEPDVNLGVGSGSHAEQTAKVLVGVESVLVRQRPKLTVVAGDVNSTVAAALAAVKLQIPVAHIEAGLRSRDESMPEEHNRRLTDHASRLLLAHSTSAVENLRAEGIDQGRVHMVGNTMVDSLMLHLPLALDRAPWKGLGLEKGGYALVTLHRPALVDVPDLLRAAIGRLRELAIERPVVFPVHPRTRSRMDELGLLTPENGLIVTGPRSYLDFIGLQAGAAFVLTDSGGIQEESSVLGVRCFTLRDTTERPVTVELGTNTVIGANPERIGDIPALLSELPSSQQIPLWDGRAGERAAEVLARFVAA
jgi:UDP-N-acetylglucosamine 2-epimerase (non-hydrolysing)